MSNVKSPELWTLVLSVGDTAIDYLIYSDSRQDSPAMGRVPLDASLPDVQRAIENAVYDTPLLLDDYGAVRVLVHSSRFVILPGDTGEDNATRMLEVAFGADAGAEAMVCRMPRCDKVIAWRVPKGLPGFLGRTFNLPAVYHHLYPLCEHFYRLNSASDIARMFLSVRPGAMDMVVYRRDCLVAANSYEFRDTGDAAYFALHAWQSLDLDQQCDEIQILGARDLRDDLAERLKPYVKYVLPAIVPAAALRFGADVAHLPLDLVLLTQCE